ncbi:hypothetical protein LCM10_05940 [Rossellomorea aquimaris]|uniref:hypothetical protein n=1 Tax=Rossellomorea aquimaris TaxID=189382 RepID=UPI001CD1A83F|nr:hypothetical protein [Rossellomorea aquimaris]MCA1054521.1 hypothetical protein [Rossellomorea aquimaris]
MLLLERIKRPKMLRSKYDLTIFQTPKYGEEKGYREVYRISVEAAGHEEALYEAFRIFNVPDLMPADYKGRYIATRDIIFIDEGRKGHHYYRLQPNGWKRVNRILIH